MENSTAKVSVIISTQNSVNYVDALCLSLFCQTEKSMQIIFVDNESTDGTWKLLQRYSQFDDRIEVYQHKSNSMLEVSYFGLSKVTAPHTLLLNGTQNIVLTQNFIKYMLENMIKFDSDLLYTSCCIFTPAFDQLSLYQVSAQDFKSVVTGDVFNADDINAALLFNLYLYPWGKMYKTEFLKKLAPEPQSVAFFLKCVFEAKRISYISDNLYMQKARPEELWTPETFAEIENCEQILLKYGRFEKFKDAFLNYKLHRIIDTFNNAPEEHKSKIFEQMKAQLLATDYSQYNPDILQKCGITSLLLKIIGLNYEQYKAIYAEQQNGQQSA